MAQLKGFKRWIALGVAAFLVLAVTAAVFYRDDILRTALDPHTPYQIYKPPPAPDYSRRDAWALMPTDPAAATDLPVDVFFVHPTTYNGGGNWNAPIGSNSANAVLTRTMLPNYAGPFVRVGRIFAPRYRQASLYTRLTLREDAREARQFAYGDMQTAFRVFLDRYNHGRPFVLVGVEQGGEMAARLLRDEIASNPELKKRLVAAYLIDTVVPATDYAPGAPVPACRSRQQTGCVLAWASAVKGDYDREQDLLERSLVWNGGQLDVIEGEPLCVNPLRGAVTNEDVPARQNMGSANATGMEWGARPAFLQRQVGAQCVDGVLRVTRPKSQALRPSGSWADRLKALGANLFYVDIEADAQARAAAFTSQNPLIPAKAGTQAAVQPR
ncbi:MAG: DUF3089 domain-containing protein [Parcubacteria group bacterium]